MQRLVGVEFGFKPNEVEIYKTGVDIITSCVETQKTDEQTGGQRIVWICDVDRYTLLEYVYYQQNQYTAFENDLIQTKVGLTEAYELILGGGI